MCDCTRYALRGVKDLYHIESQSDISILRSKNIEFAIGKHIDKRKYIYGQCSKIRKLVISSITTAKGIE